mgnify:CR=1 FL=1
MVVDLKKCQPVSNITINLENDEGGAGIYCLFQVDASTPRYNRVNGRYVFNPEGRYVFDFYDITERKPRVLKYIGESKYVAKRIMDHWYTGDKDKSKAKGVGPVFNFVRFFKYKKRFLYDNVRIVEESKLIQKFLPALNTAAKLSDKYKMILLNSKGKLKPQDLFLPYVVHARDIYKAYQAWLHEDEDYIDQCMTPPDGKQKERVSYYNKKTGKKLDFGKWLRSAVLRRHIKQDEINKVYIRNIKRWTKEYAPEYYEDYLAQQRKYDIKFRNKKSKQLKLFKGNGL